MSCIARCRTVALAHAGGGAADVRSRNATAIVGRTETSHPAQSGWMLTSWRRGQGLTAKQVAVMLSILDPRVSISRPKPNMTRSLAVGARVLRRRPLMNTVIATISSSSSELSDNCSACRVSEFRTFDLNADELSMVAGGGREDGNEKNSLFT